MEGDAPWLRGSQARGFRGDLTACVAGQPKPEAGLGFSGSVACRCPAEWLQPAPPKFRQLGLVTSSPSQAPRC